MPRVLPRVLRWKEIARKWATQTGLTDYLVLGLVHQESGGNGGAADYRRGLDSAPVRYSRNVLALAAEYRAALGG